MACFLVPATEAVVSTVVTKAIQTKEKRKAITSGNQAAVIDTEVKTPFSQKLKWLNNMLWGGSVLLAFEHVWHGEVMPWFPFLTAANNPGDTALMLHEMSTVGVTMAALVTAVWIGMAAVSNVIEKHPQTDIQTSEEGA